MRTGSPNIMNECLNVLSGQLQYRQSDGKPEAARSGATRIEVKRALNGLDLSLMRVTGNHDVNAARHRIQVKCTTIVEDVDRTPAERHQSGLWIRLRPLRGVDVPSNRNHRRNLAELVDDLRSTDVPGMDDLFNPFQSAFGLRPEEPMGI